MSRRRPTSLITGASAGIGASFARQLAALGHDLVLTARREDRLAVIAAEIVARHGATVTILPKDLGEPGAAEALATALSDRDLEIDWLINNAGYGVPGTFDSQAWQTHRASLRVLLEVPTELVWRLLPGMQERQYGRIINVASLAGLVPGTAGHTLYPAMKSYLIKFSEALALENEDRGIHVCALCPGFTWSEFHDVTGTRTLMDQLPGYLWQSADAVVSEGIRAVEAGQVVCVTGRVNRAIRGMVKLIPDRIALRLAARQSRRFRNSDRDA